MRELKSFSRTMSGTMQGAIPSAFGEFLWIACKILLHHLDIAKQNTVLLFLFKSRKLSKQYFFSSCNVKTLVYKLSMKRKKSTFKKKERKIFS